MEKKDYRAEAQRLMQFALFNDKKGESANGWDEATLEMWLRSGCKCVYCDRDMCESFVIHIFDAQCDHLLPKQVYRELEKQKSNWVLACSACNKWKGTYNANNDGKQLYVAGSGTPLSDDQRAELIRRVRACKDRYEAPVKNTLAQQKEVIEEVLRRDC